jgi:phosphoenolpyruvate---glycerone phosphotransferase subunit DhaL
MLDAAARGLARRGRCVVGDKTILDTLRPAADAAVAGDTPGQMLMAAWRGMRSTRPLIARRGLALRMGARSSGHLDPGAVSCFILLSAVVR